MRKKLLIGICALGIAAQTSATVLTVSNDVNSPGQYTTINDAISAASPGDTILVAGSPNLYSGATVNKDLHLVGAGYNPNKENPLTTRVSAVNFTSAADGSSIQGFSVTSTNGIGCQASNMKIHRNQCLITLGDVENVQIYNNIIIGFSPYFQGIRKSGFSVTTNLIISNNIFDNARLTLENNGTDDSQGTLVSNNLFIWQGVASTNSVAAFFPENISVPGITSYITVSGNMFIGMHPGHRNFNSYVENCSFSNNLSFQCPTGLCGFYTNGSNTAGNNLEDIDPEFVSNSDLDFDTTDDFNLSATSPARNAGADGTDIGIYGGLYPWPDGGASLSGYMYGQESEYPQVNSMNIINAAVPQNGTLQVEVTGIIQE